MKDSNRPIQLALLSNAMVLAGLPLMVLLDGNIFVILLASIIGFVLAIYAAKKNIERRISVRIVSTFGMVFNFLVMIGAIGMLIFIGQLVHRITALT